MIDTVIFDLGGVLIDWNPVYLYNKLITDPEKQAYFFDQICTSDWNEMQDAGRTLAEGTADRIAAFPEWAPMITAYYDRWTEMLGGAIEPTVEIFNQLRSNPQLKLYALTNWSHETFPIAKQHFEFLHRFDGVLVSGEEKTRKPFRRIYQLMNERFSIEPSKALFIDDNLRNIIGAREVGWDCIHFTDAATLASALKERSLL
jgi:2-haloacid dehalogenase